MLKTMEIETPIRISFAEQFQAKMVRIALLHYTSIMSEIFSKTETRGRPRKNTEERLPPISRKLFSEHCAVFYACCMVYVLEVFIKTKQEKRIGHSQGGFTIYQKSSTLYCFDTFEEDIKEWGFAKVILGQRQLCDFVRTANGCAPKFVFKELVTLFVQVHKLIVEEKIQSLEQLQNFQCRLLNEPQAELNRTYKYIRFTMGALKELKMERWHEQVSKKINHLWRPFLKIVTYTIFCVEKGIENNKYLKPFFSDAEHPEETIIGQLNLEQIVQEREQKTIHSSINLGFTKISKSIDEEGTDKVKSAVELDNSLAVVDHTPQANRRPITLITFPSNQGFNSVSPGGRLSGDHQENDHSSPVKKIKKE